jgi:hypothetical protein
MILTMPAPPSKGDDGLSTQDEFTIASICRVLDLCSPLGF